MHPVACVQSSVEGFSVSRRRQYRNQEPASALHPPSPKAENDRKKPRESRWNSPLCVALFAALIAAIVGPLATLILTDYFEARKKSLLTFRSSETILINGRVVEAIIVNTGAAPAKEIVVAIESAPASFEFNPEHVHTQPPVPFETTVKKGRLEIKLLSPLGQDQTLSIIADDLHVNSKQDPMFLVWATSDRGLADRQGHEVRSHPELTLEGFLSYEDGRNAAPPPSKEQMKVKGE
jgi:hypothetical protein